MSYPLEGVKILELGQIIAGTYGAQVLSDMGAEVIKVEAPEGDLGRNPSIAHGCSASPRERSMRCAGRARSPEGRGVRARAFKDASRRLRGRN